MVERVPQPEDRRSVVLSLTTTGKENLSRIEGEMDRLFGIVLASIPVEKRAQVLETLTLLLENLPSLT
jgi:DNA-binding MarR family transcriptional regulator